VGVGDRVGIGSRVGDGVRLGSGAFTVGDGEVVWDDTMGSGVDVTTSSAGCVSREVGWSWHPLKSTTLRRANTLRLILMEKRSSQGMVIWHSGTWL
jgi:hypothetical protein